MSLMSMTGFAARVGEAGGTHWSWEVRSVNGRGLDLRPRLPEGAEALESVLRTTFGAVLSRGSVTVTLRFCRGEGIRSARLNTASLAAVLAAAQVAEEAAREAGLPTAPISVAELLSIRGVLEAESEGSFIRADLLERLAEDLEPLAAGLVEARRCEGAALAKILVGQLDVLKDLTSSARKAAETRAARSGTLLRQRVEALLATSSGLDESRIAQELALLAIRVDVSEEIDRLEVHIETARDLVDQGGIVGRRLDFLLQEFNREANTLASKAQSSELTAVALDMKVVIDQMREQVQNVE